MSRHKVGREWVLEDPRPAVSHGYVSGTSRRGYAVMAGELVQGGPGIVERDRQASRRAKAKAVTA